ncbi:phytochrome A [Tanacetum coccineum]
MFGLWTELGKLVHKESGDSFDYSSSVHVSSTVVGGQQPRSDKVTTAYLHHIQKGKSIQPFGCLLALDEKTFKVLAYSENAPEMLTTVSHTVPNVGQTPVLGIGTDVRTIFAGPIATALFKALGFGERDSEKEESIEPQTTLSYKMSQPANDEFSQHLSDDEAYKNHEDASDTVKYGRNSEWKLQDEEFSTERIEHMRRFHGMDDAKEIWEAIRTRFGEGLRKADMTDFNSYFLQLAAHGLRTYQTEFFEQKFKVLQNHLHVLNNVAFVSQSKSRTNIVSLGFTGGFQYLTLFYFFLPMFLKKKFLLVFADEVLYSSLPKKEDLDLLLEDLEIQI